LLGVKNHRDKPAAGQGWDSSITGLQE
jgi:hypothetical protein